MKQWQITKSNYINRIILLEINPKKLYVNNSIPNLYIKLIRCKFGTIHLQSINIYSTHNNSMDEFFGITNESIWLASPSSGNSDWVLALDPNYKCLRAIMTTTINVCPVVPLDIEN